MDFSETVIVYGVKVGRCRNLNENMNLYEYQRSRSFIWSRSFVDLGQGHSHLLVLNFFSLETTKPIEAKFHVEPPLDGAGGGVIMKACSNVPGHVTKMAAMPIYGKIVRNLLRWNQKANDHETWYAASSTRELPSLSNRCH